jgi:hypothetical protein
MTLRPKDAQSWISRSFVLHDLKRTQEAYDLLLPGLDKFTDESVIPYNLACYACQLGEHARAKELLAVAMNDFAPAAVVQRPTGRLQREGQ